MFEHIVMYLHKKIPMISIILCWGHVISQIMPCLMPDYNLAGFNGWRSQVFLVIEQNRSRTELYVILSKKRPGPCGCNKTFTKS